MNQDGGFFDRNTLKQNAPVNAQGVLVEGLAKRVFVCPKGNGGQNSMLVDGQIYPVENGLTYQVTSHYLHVKVYNDNIKNGKAMGKWWIEVDTQRANIEVMGDTVPEPPVTELPTPPAVELPADQTTYTVTQNQSENTLTQQILTNEDRMAEIIAILKAAGVDVSTSPLSMPNGANAYSLSLRGVPVATGGVCPSGMSTGTSSLTQAEIDALLAELAQLQTTTTTLETQLAVVQNTLKTVYYVYDDNRIIEERDENDYLVSSYVYGNGIDEVVEMMRFGERYYYHLNTLGTVYALTDNSGNVVERYEYDAYGKVTIYNTDQTVERSYSIVGNFYTFTGRQLDYETGLYYYRARMYDPETGRFLSHDPLGYVDGMGLFEYVKNNPIMGFDPFGLEEKGFLDYFVDAAIGIVTGAKVASQIPMAGAKYITTPEGFDQVVNLTVQTAKITWGFDKGLLKTGWSTITGTAELAFHGQLVYYNRMSDAAYAVSHPSEVWSDPFGIQGKWAPFPESDAYFASIKNGGKELLKIMIAHDGAVLYKLTGYEGFAECSVEWTEFQEVLGEVVNRKWEEIKRYTPEQQAELLGRIAGELLLLCLPVTKAGQASKVSQLSKLEKIKEGMAIADKTLKEIKATTEVAKDMVATEKAAITMSKGEKATEAGKVAKTAPAPAIVAPKLLKDLVPNIPDNAFVHFSPNKLSQIKPNEGASFWFRFGNIKNLTPKQIETVIGGGARSGVSGGTKYMHVAKDSSKISPSKVSGYDDFPEFVAKESVSVDSHITQ